MSFLNAITDIPGIRVGHAQDDEALTGCTVILCEAGATGGVDQRGGAPGTRETDALHTVHLVEQVHAVVLAGGSAFGLDAASGAVRYLEERGVGFNVGVARVPIVPSAILFDLSIGRADVRPGPEMGYHACVNASSGRPSEGNVGAGTGATVGKALGMGLCMKSGIGTASLEIGGGLLVGAIAAVNAFGDVIDPTTGQIVAGARAATQTPMGPGDPGFFVDTMQVLRQTVAARALRFNVPQNTVLGVVATNARLNKEQVNKMAQMAQDGLARTIRPAHTMVDGDTVFALATGQWPDKKASSDIGGKAEGAAANATADASLLGAFAAEALAQAILRGVRCARSTAGIPGLAGPAT
jgi:L-aminopeptidase/D-esterase-like protein